MIEIPEANTLTKQINAKLTGKIITSVVAASSPHKFAWYYGDPAEYQNTLKGNQILSAMAVGGMVEVKTTYATLLFHDGASIRYLNSLADAPAKHQLLIIFSDCSGLVSSVQMYGGLYCWPDTVDLDYIYYQVAREKPSPLDKSRFTQEYFESLLFLEDVQKISLKAALATQQRVPGLGNGVLQDILWNARLSPKRKVNTLSKPEFDALYQSTTNTLMEMTHLGGRDTEKDLFDQPGGYEVVMSARNNGSPCPNCGTAIRKEAYMGGSVYFCPTCQQS
jgi:formamidopyrimidine-DNA glycosylase